MKIEDLDKGSAPKSGFTELVFEYAKDGLLRMILEECQRCAPKRRQPILAVAAAIVAVGALAGRHYFGPTSLGTNVYAMGLGRSSCGKDTAQAVVAELFIRSGYGFYLAGEPESGSAVQAHLSKHPSRIYLFDELGEFTTKITNPNAPPYIKGIRKKAMEAYSKGQKSRTLQASGYADDTASKKAVDVVEPCLCWYGAGTAETHWENVKNGAIRNGFYPRWLLFPVGNELPPLVEDRQPMNISDDMIYEARLIVSQGRPEFERGNLEKAPVQTMKPEAAEKSTLIPWGEGAKAEHDKWWFGTAEERQNAAKNDDEDAVIGKWGEHALKLMAIRAISRDPANAVITVEDVDLSWRITEHCLNAMIYGAKKHASENQREADFKKILNLIEEAGAHGIAHGEFHAGTRTIDSKQRSGIVAELIDDGTIKERKGKAGPNGGKPPKFYVHQSFF
jgi:hypothetical protein